MRPNDFMLEVFQPWIRGFRELFVMPESIYSIQRHFIGNSTNASGAKGCACPAGKGELKVCMSFEPHFISSPGIRAFPPFWPFFPFCGPPRCETMCQALLAKRRKRRKLFALSGLRTQYSVSAAAISVGLSNFNALPFWGRFVLLIPECNVLYNMLKSFCRECVLLHYFGVRMWLCVMS